MPLIPMNWHSLLARNAKSLKAALQKGLRAIDGQVNSSLSGGQRATQLEPLFARNAPKQPLHPLARIRQSQSRQYSTARQWLKTTIREVSSSRAGVKYDRSSFPKSTIGNTVRASTGRAPFASTLRPNLTGGTLGRTAGGYSQAGAGGARYFSHAPALQAQVVSNVSQAMRAFFTQGKKLQYNGVDGNGKPKFKTVSSLQEETGRKVRDLPQATPGSWIEFSINPTITALTPLASLVNFNGYASEKMDQTHLNTSGLLDILSVDFSRTLKDLATTLNDLHRLSALGDLPITSHSSSLRIHFPGCDAETVERLSEEFNIQRGTVHQDQEFDSFAGTEIALLFPFAPSNEPSESTASSALFDFSPSKPSHRCPLISLQDMLSRSAGSPAYSTTSDTGFEDILNEAENFSNPWCDSSSSSSAYQSVHPGSEMNGYERDTPLEYQGFEGIYKFLEELDAVRR